MHLLPDLRRVGLDGRAVGGFLLAQRLDQPVRQLGQRLDQRPGSPVQYGDGLAIGQRTEAARHRRDGGRPVQRPDP